MGGNERATTEHVTWRYMPRSQRWILIATSVVVLVLSIDPVKPIWNDEFLHFAFGAFDSAHEAVSTILKSISGVNHGQTGVFILLDYCLLRLFGASAFWLRFPSLVAGAFLIFSCHILFDNWRLPAPWRVACLVALFGQPSLLGFVSEARPYIPLAACSVGALAYYTSAHDERRTLVGRSVGWISVLGGSLMHPYFVIYWFAAVMCSEFHRAQFTIRGFFKRINPALAFVGLTLYTIVARVTWTRGRPEFSLDPFEYLGSGANAVKALFSMHFGFLGPVKAPLVGLVTLVALGVILTRWGRSLTPLIEPALLVFVALGLSVFVSVVSYRAHYWILQRQWIASTTLAALGSVVLIYHLASFMRPTAKVVLEVVLICAMSVQTLMVGSTAIRKWGRATTTRAVDTATVRPEAQPASMVEWVALANANVAAGGEVWPIFRRYYGK